MSYDENPDVLFSSASNGATLVDLLQWRSARHPDKPSYTFLIDGDTEHTTITYRELDIRARAIAVALTNIGASGKPTLLLYPAGLDYICALFGCWYAGSIPVPTYPPHSDSILPRLEAIISDSGATIALGTKEVAIGIPRWLPRVPSLRELSWLTTDTVPRTLAAEWSRPPLSSDSLALLQYTSGSTATPKGVMVTHGNLLSNEEMIRQACKHTSASTFVGWLPLYHDMGLIGNVLQPVYIGALCVLMSPLSFLQHPFLWLKAISRYGAHTSGGPNFAYELCIRKIPAEQRAELDLRAWRVAFNGAEPVRAETMTRFASAFAQSGFQAKAFYPCYGLAEATLFVAGAGTDSAPDVCTVDAPALEDHRVVVTPT
ncbi:MAG TPA: AMP-binding protein, partial [Blastocatellia bacterium]|nr:AMP-binding protein [Blastocatellia bacterium]